MAGPPITLAAALRDATHDNPKVRDKALRHMADALLAEIDRDAPRWRAAARHPRGAAVLEALGRAVREDPSPVLQGFAAIGLGQLGDPLALPVLREALETAGEGEELSFRRECGAIALAELAAAAKDEAAAALLPTLTAPLAAGLASPYPEVRFQCAGALVDVLGDEAEGAIAEALPKETNFEVRRGLCEALARVDHPSPATVERLRAIANDDEIDLDTRFAAALGLTAARDPDASPVLREALRNNELRDRALEALAALGPGAPKDVLPALREIVESWLKPRVTKVRAAYALARIAPAEGLPLLDRFARSRSAAVREAVADARAAIATLSERE
ncbi:MAG: HEAT repeat domain-containing protein [Myxococcales bacterium]|nr:HEAT repeat domain-containing protein [Myxococcales bacterium]